LLGELVVRVELLPIMYDVNTCSAANATTSPNTHKRTDDDAGDVMVVSVSVVAVLVQSPRVTRQEKTMIVRIIDNCDTVIVGSVFASTE
jgi:hypothetical protein